MSEQRAIYNAANPVAALALLWSTLKRQPGVDDWSELVEAERVVREALMPRKAVKPGKYQLKKRLARVEAKLGDHKIIIERVKRMEEALEWYARRRGCGHQTQHGWRPCPIDEDAGDRARQALGRAE